MRCTPRLIRDANGDVEDLPGLVSHRLVALDDREGSLQHKSPHREVVPVRFVCRTRRQRRIMTLSLLRVAVR